MNVAKQNHSRTPLVKQIKRKLLAVPGMRKLSESMHLYRMYGRFHPERLRPPNSENWLYVDLSEPRGRTVLLCGGRGQPTNKRFWHRAVKTLQPTIVLDVGLNYGEFLFAESYRPEARLIGIEANEKLRPWVERSREAHPNREQIELCFAIASEKSDEGQAFYVDTTSSGRSSAIEREDRPEMQVCHTRSVAIDDFFANADLSSETLLFKIDVEGYETFVLRGMPRLLKECARSVGIMELNTAFCRELEIDPAEFLNELLTRFAIFAYEPGGRGLRIESVDMQALAGFCGQDDFQLDLVLASQAALLEELGVAESRG